MFASSAGGEVTTLMASDMLAAKRVVSALADISGPIFVGATGATHPLLSAGPYGTIIGRINILYQAAGAGAAGALDIGHTDGTTTDNDSIVDNMAIPITAVAGSVVGATLANTLRGTSFMTGGLPVIPPGYQVFATLTQGAGNTADFVIEIFYSDLEPGQ